jgi:hypothetical protein
MWQEAVTDGQYVGPSLCFYAVQGVRRVGFTIGGGNAMKTNDEYQTPETQSDSSLVQLTYVSGATIPFSDDEIGELLLDARRNNEANAITGILLFHAGSFLQVLEGPVEAVDTVFATISRDPRHSRILVLQRQAINHREFAEHPLEFLAISPETCALAPFTSASLQRLFREFCDGKWQRAFDCHRKENAGVPICNPFFAAIWSSAESGVHIDQTNIQVDNNHSQAAQNSGEML